MPAVPTRMTFTETGNGLRTQAGRGESKNSDGSSMVTAPVSSRALRPPRREGLPHSNACRMEIPTISLQHGPGPDSVKSVYMTPRWRVARFCRWVAVGRM